MADPARTLEPRENRTPAVLLVYQQRWVADTCPVKWMEKSRRVGLSWSEAADSALLASKTNGMNCFYIGYVKQMAQEFINDCADWARYYALAAEEISETEEVWIDGDDKKSITIYTLRFASGFRIEALSSAPRNLRGKQGRVILDEYAFHTARKELLKAAMALLIWGGQVHVISTHDGADNDFNEVIGDIRAGKVPYSLHRVTFMDAIADGLYERIMLRTGQPTSAEHKEAWIASIYAMYRDNADEELDCIPKNSSGAWLSRNLIEARMVDAPVLRWAPPAKDFVTWPEERRTAEMRDWLELHVAPLLAALDPALDSFMGEDFGRIGDLTVLAPGQVMRDLTRRFPFLLELRDCPFDQQREALFFIGERLPRLRAVKLDARGNGHYLAEKALQKWGEHRVECVMLSQTWYRENTAPLKSAFEDGTIELPRDKDTLDDLRAVEVVKGIPMIPEKRSAAADGGKRHGDSAVALMLAYAASRAEAPPAAGARVEAQADTYMPKGAADRWGRRGNPLTRLQARGGVFRRGGV